MIFGIHFRDNICDYSLFIDKLIIVTEDNDAITPLKQTISKITKIHPTSISVKHIELIPRNESGKVLYNELNRLINL